MLEFVQRIFDTESFMPHGHCYLWRPDILTLNVGSDFLIAASYYTIPAFLVYFVVKRGDLSFNWLLVMFATFILACGTTHVMDIWTVWSPQYGLQGFVKAFTALVSVATAIAMVRLMPKALALPVLQDLEKSSEDLRRSNEELRRMNCALEERIIEKTKKVDLNEERFRRVIEATPAGLLMVDKSGQVALCNKELESQFGYKREELIGQPMEILVPERFRAAHPGQRGGFFQSPETRQMGAGRDLFGRRKDGTEFPVEIGLNPMVTDGGTFVLASIVDITKRKTLEERIQQTSDRIQQKNHEMEQFVYTVSHDLKSPLVTSSGFLGLLKEDIAAKKFDKVADSLLRLERANTRMSQLIDDLLQLSRIGRIKLEVEKINMSHLLLNIQENLSAQLKEKSVNFMVQENLPEIEGDRRRIYQVFENLIINALKYACEGPEPLLQIGAESLQDEIRFFVKDKGPGIDKAYHRKIFGLFQRLETDGRGTGVGLTIVSRVMQLHGGRVWVESDLGQGATFWLAFPKFFVSPNEVENDS